MYVLVILLVVILALILWQVVRIYFDYKSGGDVDFSAVKALGQQTFTSGSKVFSSFQKWWAAATPEDKAKYREKMSTRASTAVGTALNTAEAGKGWFQQLREKIVGKPAAPQPSAPSLTPQPPTPAPQQTRYEKWLSEQPFPPSLEKQNEMKAQLA